MSLKHKRIITAGLLAFVFCLISFMTPSAHEIKGSLTLQCIFNDNGNKTVLAGDTYGIKQIACSQQNGSVDNTDWRYETLSEYKEYDCNWSGLTSMQLREKAAAVCEAVVDKGTYLDKKTTDSNGKLVFDGLEPGLYLIVRTNAVNTSYEFEPSLIFVPQTSEGELIYDVDAEPKFSKKTDTDSPSTTPDGEKLPQTGQLIWPIFVLSILGLVLVVSGVVIIKKERKNENSVQ